MGRKLFIKIERDFGDLIGDGMKVVFRNIIPILHAILWYAFPFIALAMVVMVLTGSYKLLLMPDEEMINNIFVFFSSFSIVSVGLALGFIMINLVVYGALYDYDQNDGKVSFSGIQSYIHHHWKNYLGSIAVEAFILGIIVMLMVGSVLISPLLFGVTYILGIVLLCYLFNIIQFLGIIRIEEGLNIEEGIRRCFYLLRNNWWGTFGVILVSSFIGSILMYAIVFPISIIIAFLNTMEITGGGENGWLVNILTGVFIIAYAVIGILSNMYISGVRGLKYFDLVEKKEATNLLRDINNMGMKQSASIFENEGEF